MREIRQGQFYRHFKGGLYQIVGVAEHTETGEKLVIYQALYGDYKIYARPYEMFAGETDHEKYPEVTQKYRFELTVPGETVTEEPEKKEPVSVAEAQKEEPPVRTAEAEPADAGVNPILLEFLDADSYEEKLNILAGLHHRITNEMITTMAISCDIEVNDGEPEERYEELKNCLLTMEKFECNRLR